MVNFRKRAAAPCALRRRRAAWRRVHRNGQLAGCGSCCGAACVEGPSAFLPVPVPKSAVQPEAAPRPTP
eukprot:363494-Chlamydomonas_euryale.AAC.4